MNDEKQDVLFSKVKNYVSTRSKGVSFNLHPNLHRSDDMMRDWNILTNWEFKPLQKNISEVWCEAPDLLDPIRIRKILPEHFWSFFLETDWHGTKVLRITDGELLQVLLEKLYLLTERGQLIRHKVAKFEKCQFPTKGGLKKPRENMPALEDTKILFTYYALPGVNREKEFSDDESDDIITISTVIEESEKSSVHKLISQENMRAEMKNKSDATAKKIPATVHAHKSGGHKSSGAQNQREVHTHSGGKRKDSARSSPDSPSRAKTPCSFCDHSPSPVKTVSDVSLPKSLAGNSSASTLPTLTQQWYSDQVSPSPELSEAASVRGDWEEHDNKLSEADQSESKSHTTETVSSMGATGDSSENYLQDQGEVVSPDYMQMVSVNVTPTEDMHLEQNHDTQTMPSSSGFPKSGCDSYGEVKSTAPMSKYAPVNFSKSRRDSQDVKSITHGFTSGSPKSLMVFKPSVEKMESHGVNFVIKTAANENPLGEEDSESLRPGLSFLLEQIQEREYRKLTSNCLTDPNEFLIFEDENDILNNRKSCQSPITRSDTKNLSQYFDARKYIKNHSGESPLDVEFLKTPKKAPISFGRRKTSAPPSPQKEKQVMRVTALPRTYLNGYDYRSPSGNSSLEVGGRSTSDASISLGDGSHSDEIPMGVFQLEREGEFIPLNTSKLHRQFSIQKMRKLKIRQMQAQSPTQSATIRDLKKRYVLRWLEQKFFQKNIFSRSSHTRKKLSVHHNGLVPQKPVGMDQGRRRAMIPAPPPIPPFKGQRPLAVTINNINKLMVDMVDNPFEQFLFAKGPVDSKENLIKQKTNYDFEECLLEVASTHLVRKELVTRNNGKGCIVSLTFTKLKPSYENNRHWKERRGGNATHYIPGMSSGKLNTSSLF